MTKTIEKKAVCFSVKQGFDGRVVTVAFAARWKECFMTMFNSNLVWLVIMDFSSRVCDHVSTCTTVVTSPTLLLQENPGIVRSLWRSIFVVVAQIVLGGVIIVLVENKEVDYVRSNLHSTITFRFTTSPKVFFLRILYSPNVSEKKIQNRILEFFKLLLLLNKEKRRSMEQEREDKEKEEQQLGSLGDLRAQGPRELYRFLSFE